MTSQDLRHTLEELHSELEQASEVDENTREMLSDIDGHIKALLAKPDRELATRHHPLTARLRESLAQFEANNPQLVPGIQRVLDAFNEFGI